MCLSLNYVRKNELNIHTTEWHFWHFSALILTIAVTLEPCIQYDTQNPKFKFLSRLYLPVDPYQYQKF